MSKKGSQAEVKNSAKESKLQVWAAVILLIVGIFGYYYFNESNLLIAFASLGAGVALFLLIFLFSATGKRLVLFFREARVELRRVVWPSWDETKKMTLMVLVVMAIFLIFLSIADWILGGVVSYLMSLFGG